jgi:tape measure domain-containing protein
MRDESPGIIPRCSALIPFKMTGFIYSIAFRLTGQSSVMNAVAATDRLDRSVNRVNGDLGRMGSTAQRAGDTARRSFDGAASSLRGWIAGLGIGLATLSSLNTAAQVEGFEQAIKFADAKEGATNLAFIRENSEALGLSLEASFRGFKQLQGGLMGTKITGQQTRDIFYAVSEGAAAMRLSADETNGVFLALSQMASKGTVQAEELRGQLGERLPGAFGIAARAMGVTTQQLNKMLEQGQVISEDFLPKFAVEMHKTFGGAVAESANSATANFNRFQSSIFNLKTTFGTELLPTVTSFLQNYLIPAVHWISQHIGLITGLGSVIGGIVVATKVWAAGQALLNIVLIANPIGLVVAGIGALIGAVVYAWNKFEGFRGFMTGMWEVIKEFGRIIYDFAIAPLMAMGKIMIGVFTFDKDLIATGMADSFAAAEKLSTSAGARVRQAFLSGYVDGVDNFSEKKDSPLFKTPGAVSSAFGSAPGSGPGGAGAGKVDIQKGLQGITSGGPKNITINVTKLVENINIHSTVKEAAADIQEVVTRALLQTINTANQAQ